MNKETAKEMFEKLGYKTDLWWEKDHTIEYLKKEEDEFEGYRIVSSIIFYKRLKKIKVSGVISIKDLQAINKQVEELGWGEDNENR